VRLRIIGNAPSTDGRVVALTMPDARRMIVRNRGERSDRRCLAGVGQVLPELFLDFPSRGGHRRPVAYLLLRGTPAFPSCSERHQEKSEEPNTTTRSLEPSTAGNTPPVVRVGRRSL